MAASASVNQAIRDIRRSLRSLDRAFGRLGDAVARATPARSTGAGRKLKLSPKRRAELRLHGRYLGHMRNLPAAHKARVKAAKAKRGYHAAIALAKKLAG